MDGIPLYSEFLGKPMKGIHNINFSADLKTKLMVEVAVVLSVPPASTKK